MFFIKDENLLLIKIFKNYLSDFDIYDKDQIIELFKSLFLKIKDKYSLSGLFSVDVYANDLYGMIIEIENLMYYENEIDLKIKFNINQVFLIEINSNEILDFNDVYYFNDKFYSVYDDVCDRLVVYKDVEKILSNGIKVC